MKRIIQGVSYNTDTSAEIARYEDEDDDGSTSISESLYQTRAGAFFTYGVRKTVSLDAASGEKITKEAKSFNPVTREEAQEWVMTGNVELYSDIFGDMPEAEDGTKSEATIYLRAPASLKDRIEKAAEAAGQSVNAWALRCLESAAG